MLKHILISLLVAGMLFAGFLWYSIDSKVCNGQSAVLLIDRDDTHDSICSKLSANKLGWSILQQTIPFAVRTGRYEIASKSKLLSTYRRIRNHQQDPINITVGEVRLVSMLPARLALRLMVDSAEIATTMNDTRFIDSLGFDAQTLPAMFIPNTYQVWWDITAHDLILRLHQEYKRFWNDKRQALAKSIGLTPIEVSTLSSIVDAETANNEEKPCIAGMYMNRLRRGMPLQADPTVVFAIGDFGLRRILHKHLATDSPYNTYRNTGLPPGPIRVASIQGIDAVLQHTHHNYIYMCAKEDFSGTHNFATTYTEHQHNAREYAKALTRKGVK